MTERPKLKLLRPYDSDSPEFEIEQVERLLDKREFPNDREWALYQAKVFYEAFGDISKATKILEKELQKDPQNADILACLAECYSRSPEHYESALECCENALEINDMSDYVHTIKARVLIATGKPIDAYFSAMAALRVNSHNFEAGVYLGVVGFAIAESEHNLEEMEFSIQNLRTTQKLNPGSQLLANIIQKNQSKLDHIRGAKS